MLRLLTGIVCENIFLHVKSGPAKLFLLRLGTCQDAAGVRQDRLMRRRRWSASMKPGSGAARRVGPRVARRVGKVCRRKGVARSLAMPRWRAGGREVNGPRIARRGPSVVIEASWDGQPAGRDSERLSRGGAIETTMKHGFESRWGHHRFRSLKGLSLESLFPETDPAIKGSRPTELVIRQAGARGAAGSWS